MKNMDINDQNSFIQPNEQKQEATQLPDSENGQLPNKQISQAENSSQSRRRLLSLAVFQVIGITVCVLLYFLANKLQNPSFGIFFVTVFIMLVPSIGILAVINVQKLTQYNAANKPHGAWPVFSAFSLMTSVRVGISFIVFAINVFIVAPSRTNEIREKARQEEEQKQQQAVVELAKQEISKAEAIEMLKACQVSSFYYTNQRTREDGSWGELSSTGIAVTRQDDGRYKMSVANSLVSELVPVARTAQRTCDGPQFWYAGSFEYKQADGTWRWGRPLPTTTN